MAAVTWFATNSLVSVHQEMSETDPGTEAYASPTTGWVVSTGSTNHAAFNSQTEVAASAFVDTTPPDGSIDTSTGDCLRSTNTYSGTFQSGNWNVHFACRAQTVGGAQDGRMRCRLFRSANADGSSATEITAAQQQGGLVSNLATSATQVSTATFDPGQFTVTNEYIFVQLAWERTGAGGMSTSDVNMRIGNSASTGTRVISSNFLRALTIAIDQGSYTYTGNAQSLLQGRKIGATQGSYTLTGNAVTLAHGYFVTAAQGTYTYTGNAANLLWGHKATADQGAYSYTGVAVTLSGAHKITISQGTYAYTGFDVILTHDTADAVIAINTGAYAYTGNAQNLLWAHRIPVNQGAYTYTGNAQNLRWNHRIAINQGSYAYSGVSVGLLAGRRVAILQGSYGLTGQSIGLFISRLIPLVAGSYVLTGRDVSLVYFSSNSYTIVLQAGSYNLTGQPITFTVGAAPALVVAEIGQSTYVHQPTVFTFTGVAINTHTATHTSQVFTKVV